MSRLTRDGTAEPVSRDQILRRERGQGNIHFPCLADIGNLTRLILTLAMCDDHAYIHAYIHTVQCTIHRSNNLLGEFCRKRYTLYDTVSTLFDPDSYK